MVPHDSIAREIDLLKFIQGYVRDKSDVDIDNNPKDAITFFKLLDKKNDYFFASNFVSAFQIAKSNKLKLLVYSFTIACSVVFTLLYANYLFLLFFPLSLL